MTIKSKLFNGICFAGIMLVALSTTSCSKPTCDLLSERPPIVHQMSMGKNNPVVEQVSDMILPDKHPVYASMAGEGDYEESEGLLDIVVEYLIKLFGGVIIFFVATFILWRNESRYLRKKHTLEEVDKNCIIMENPNTRDPSMEGKLVCATATASTEEILTDPDFGIEINAISLQRKAKYYQWVEEKETRGSGKNRRTVYTYKKKWVNEPIESESFHNPNYQDRNFVLVRINNEEQWARIVSFGAYILNDELKEFMVPDPLILDLDDKILAKWNDAVVNTLEENELPYPRKAKNIYKGSPLVTGNEAQERNLTVSGNEVTPIHKEYDYVHQDKNVLYFGNNPKRPTVGDVRLYFKKVMEGTVTVVSQVAGITFVPYESRVQEDYQTLVMGESNDDLIIADETTENKKNHWMTRIKASLATGVGLFMSFNVLFQILSYLFSFVPFISQYLQSLVDLTGFVFLIACLFVGIVWSVINIFLAWIINLVIVNIDDWMG